MIRVTGLVKEFAGSSARAVNQVNFEVPSGAFVTLLGPSGCGKTTSLRCIAGLEEPTHGRIEIGDRVVFDAARKIAVSPNKRRIGMVFQSYAIWPHMTVFGNVAYPLQTAKVNKREIRERVMASLELVGLADLAPRRAPNLSGGQQQRVALARALVAEPEILLLDEPLSNLDAKLREQMRQEIRELQQRLGITTLYVTHDQVEALAISDIVGVMSGGKVVDFGSPQRIYRAPKSKFVAEFIGLANVIAVNDVRPTPEDDGVLEGTTPMGRMLFHLGEGPALTGDETGILVRLEDVEISRERPPASRNVWRAKLVSVLFLGTHLDCVLEMNGQRLRGQAAQRDKLEAGEEVWIQIQPDHATALSGDGATKPSAMPSQAVPSAAAGAS